MKPHQIIAQNCLAFRVRRLNRIISSVFDQELRPFGLKSSQLNLLVAVASAPACSATLLCEHLALEKSTVSRNMERLTETGLVQVERPDGGNSVSYKLTTEGQEILTKVFPAWKRAQKKAEEILGKDADALFSIA